MPSSVQFFACRGAIFARRCVPSAASTRHTPKHALHVDDRRDDARRPAVVVADGAAESALRLFPAALLVVVCSDAFAGAGAPCRECACECECE